MARLIDEIKCVDPTCPCQSVRRELEKVETPSVLQEAETIINGDRRTDYGTATASFERIASMWSGYLGIDLSPHDVAMLMVLLKVARSKQGIDTTGAPQRDSLVDIAGYAGCSEKVMNGL
jgi:hypothetical protein